MEYVIINEVPVPVPDEVVSAGRDAVTAWIHAQVSPPPSALSARSEPSAPSAPSSTVPAPAGEE